MQFEPTTFAAYATVGPGVGRERGRFELHRALGPGELDPEATPAAVERPLSDSTVPMAASSDDGSPGQVAAAARSRSAHPAGRSGRGPPPNPVDRSIGTRNSKMLHQRPPTPGRLRTGRR